MQFYDYQLVILNNIFTLKTCFSNSLTVKKTLKTIIQDIYIIFMVP